MPLRGACRGCNDLSQFVWLVGLALDCRVAESARIECEKRLLRDARRLAALGFFEHFAVRAAPLRTLFEDEGIVDRG